jgi:hypothetical protein
MSLLMLLIRSFLHQLFLLLIVILMLLLVPPLVVHSIDFIDCCIQRLTVFYFVSARTLDCVSHHFAHPDSHCVLSTKKSTIQTNVFSAVLFLSPLIDA